jgi:hypothetical protein
MRPTSGAIATEAQLQKDIDGDWLCQPKLDGDRVILGVAADGLIFTSRHLGEYSFQVKNAAKFKHLQSGTCLDGECWKGNFYPFETLAIGNQSFLGESVERRVGHARYICELVGVPWLFEPITDAGWIKRAKKTPEIEGYVKKRLGSTYEITGSQRDSLEWVKCKWAKV